MSESRDKLNTTLDYEIRRYEEAREKLSNFPMESIEEAFPGGRWSYDRLFELNYDLPLDFKEVDRFQSWMKENLPEWDLWGEFRHAWSPKSAVVNITYHLVGQISFEVNFRYREEGSSCAIHYVGDEKSPVYEIVCLDGANEPIIPRAKQEQPK